MFKHRPSDPNDTDWEDNAPSNALAWASEKLLPKYCKTPEHYSSRIANYFWTDCPCCLFWRGYVIGAISVAIVGAALYVLAITL